MIDEIQDLNKKIDEKQKEIDVLVVESENVMQGKEKEKLHTRVEALEQEIEERMNALKELRGEKKK